MEVLKGKRDEFEEYRESWSKYFIGIVVLFRVLFLILVRIMIEKVGVEIYLKLRIKYRCIFFF